jgi:hypothetical protein
MATNVRSPEAAPRPPRVLAGAARVALLVAASAVGGCSAISTVRVQPENVYVGPHLRAIAVVHAQATSAYVLFFPIPGEVDLDRVVNRMLITAAKRLGADKIVNLQVDVTPDHGIWTLRKLLGWRTAEASAIAVVVEDDPAAAAAAVPPPAAP